MWVTEAEVIVGYDHLSDGDKSHYSRGKKVFLDPEYEPARQAAREVGIVYRVRLCNVYDFAFACAMDAYNFKHVSVSMRNDFKDFTAILDSGEVWESGAAMAWAEHGTWSRYVPAHQALCLMVTANKTINRHQGLHRLMIQ